MALRSRFPEKAAEDDIARVDPGGAEIPARSKTHAILLEKVEAVKGAKGGESAQNRKS